MADAGDRRGSPHRTAPSLGRDALSGRLDRALAALDGRSAPIDRWRRGWLLTAAGRYGQALDELQGARSGDLLIQASAATTEGMLLRQVALHERAEQVDAEALELLHRSGTRNAKVRAAIRIGQVADAVGLGMDDAALSRRLQVAAAATTAAGSWRQQVRLTWVRGEVAMVRTRIPLAAKVFAEGVAIASDQGAKRHTAKSLIFLAAARAARGERGDAVRVAVRGLQLAAQCGAAPLLWPAELILAEVEPDAAETHLERARSVVTGLLEGLPEELRAEAVGKPPASWLLAGSPLARGRDDAPGMIRPEGLDA